MSIPKRNLLINSIFTSQFNCFQLTWMFRSLTMNSKVNRLYEWCLRNAYNYKTSFGKLLEKDELVTMCTINLQILITEMFKVYRNLSQAAVADLFHVPQNKYKVCQV